MLVVPQATLDGWFEERLRRIDASPPARAYLISLFSSMRSSTNDMSRDSVVLAYSRARDRSDFVEFQRLGDWVLWSVSMVPESIREAELVVDLGRLSYYACWRILRGEWRLYEELADDMPRLSHQVRRAVFR